MHHLNDGAVEEEEEVVAVVVVGEDEEETLQVRLVLFESPLLVQHCWWKS